MNLKLWLVAAVCVSLSAPAAPKWDSPDATVCVEVSVESSPDEPRLGVFVKVPDGGMLPEPFAVPQAYTEDGKPLETVVYGYDKLDGVGVLFAEPPDGGKVARLYFSPSRKPPAKPASATLFPSLVLFTRSGKGALDIAKSLQSRYPYGQDAAFDRWNWCGSMVNPFGPDDNYSLWFVGGFVLEQPERIWFATVSDEGSEVLIDGRKVASWSGVHTRKQGAKGQHGSFVQLDKGLHRFDYFQFELTGKQEAQLVWKRPGVETKNGLPEMLTGFAKSGRGKVASVRYKDGRVCGTLVFHNQKGIEQPISYFWFGERPVNLFSVTAHVPEGAKATLDFGKGRKLAAPVATWLAVGSPDELSVPVTLSVENAAGAARVTRRLRSPWTPAKASLEKAEDRLAYRRAFLCMLDAVPPPGDPCAEWASDLWGLLVELMEPYKGGPLLERIFEDGFASLRKRPDWQRWKLEDRFIEFLRLQKDGNRLLSWIARLEKAERDGTRKFRWREERVCALLLDLARPDAAARELDALKKGATGPEQAQVALLRAGDVARALGKHDEALKFYRDAEEGYRARHKAGGRRTGAASKGAGVARFKLPDAPKGEEWKTYTVRNASLYKTILSQLEQGAFDEALQTLRAWENESPTGKLEGEYTMAEARVYRALGDSRRVVNALDVYVRNTVMTAELADAMKLEAECLDDLKETARRRALAKEFLKRFPGHPYGEEMEKLK